VQTQAASAAVAYFEKGTFRANPELTSPSQVAHRLSEDSVSRPFALEYYRQLIEVMADRSGAGTAFTQHAIEFGVRGSHSACWWGNTAEEQWGEEPVIVQMGKLATALGLPDDARMWNIHHVDLIADNTVGVCEGCGCSARFENEGVAVRLYRRLGMDADATTHARNVADELRASYYNNQCWCLRYEPGEAMCQPGILEELKRWWLIAGVDELTVQASADNLQASCEARRTVIIETGEAPSMEDFWDNMWCPPTH
jgi:hypothetical protein